MNNPMDGATFADINISPLDINISPLERRVAAIEHFLLNALEDACIDGGVIRSARELKLKEERKRRIAAFEETHSTKDSAEYVYQILTEVNKAIKACETASDVPEGE